MKNPPLISVVIPVYNGERFIEQSIISVVKQPCSDVEIVVIDDGSTDGTLNIIKSLEQKYDTVYAYHIDNGGVSNARNYGLSLSQGKYVAFLDADDVWAKNVYDDALYETLKNNSYDIIKMGYGIAEVTLSRGNHIVFESGYLESKDDKFKAQFRDHISSYIYNRNLLDENIKFPNKVSYGEDMIFLYKCACKAKNIFIENKIFFYYRSNPSSAVHSLNLWNSKISEINAWNDMKKSLMHKDDISGCNSTIWWLSIRLIMYGCEIGVPYNEILELIKSNKSIQEVLIEESPYEKIDTDIEFFDAFMDNPSKIWKKIRSSGRKLYLLKLLKNTVIGKVLDKKFRYRLDLADLI